jgi:Methyltransferase domain
MVIELGCGQAGGHIPALIRAGYDATGVDPEAPQGAAYRQAAFEDYQPGEPADAVIASVSLHHVDDPGTALDHVAGVLRPDGALIVIEWISEDFDEATARWCFGHQLREADEPGAWLPVLYAEWAGVVDGRWPGHPGWTWSSCPAGAPSREALPREAPSPEVASRSRNGPTRCPSWAECRNRLPGFTVYLVRRPVRVRVMYPAASRSATTAWTVRSVSPAAVAMSRIRAPGSRAISTSTWPCPVSSVQLPPLSSGALMPPDHISRDRIPAI